MLLKDLQFENGTLVKVRRQRPQYMSGNDMIRLIDDLGGLVYSLRHQLLEVTGTLEEYSDMQCQSLLSRHLESCVRAKLKLEQL